MPDASLVKPAAPSALVRAVVLALQGSLLAYLVFGPTVFGHFHRFADMSMLFAVCQLLALWVVVSLVGFPLRHARSAVNVFIALLLCLLLFQVVPLPKTGVVAQAPETLGSLREVLLDGGAGVSSRAEDVLRVGRFSILPGPAVGVLVLGLSAAGIYWLVASAVFGRKPIRRAAWAVLIGVTLLAGWVLVSALAGYTSGVGGVSPPPAIIPIYGGDSLAPALLAALPLAVALVLRPLGWLPRAKPHQRLTRFGWVVRPGVVWAGIGLVMLALVAAAVGASHIGPVLRAACIAAAAGLPLAAYALGPNERLGRRAIVVLAAGLGAWVAAAAALGSLLGTPDVESSRAKVESLHGLFPARDLLGWGAGSISPFATFGSPGWPIRPGDDGDTSGYHLIAAELGLVGLALVGAMIAAMAIFLLRAVLRSRSPWTHLAPLVGLGALVANAVYFAFDSSALLAPNLLALAAVMGIATAWSIHGDTWRPEPRKVRGEAHWPFVVGAIGLAGTLGLAESAMLPGAGGVSLNDKVLHFGTFAAICLLVCYALGPKPTARFLKARIVLAFLVAAALGVGIEFGQRWFTAGRAFEWWDIAADLIGAGAVGLFWWILRRGQAAAEQCE